MDVVYFEVFFSTKKLKTIDNLSSLELIEK